MDSVREEANSVRRLGEKKEPSPRQFRFPFAVSRHARDLYLGRTIHE